MVLFEWDEKKAASNRRKHGITFDEAMKVFDDPFALAEQDRIENGERRWQIIGMFEEMIILFVAYAVQEEGHDEVVRIISARRASRKERIRYDQNRQENLY